MPTLYGESTVYSYEAQGGIALMSNDPSEGTVSGGSGGDLSGVTGVPTRILWSISTDGDGNYTGGITGYSAFLGTYTYYIVVEDTQIPVTATGPFNSVGVEEQAVLSELYAYALSNENLNRYFEEWNQNPVNVQNFINYLYYYEKLTDCVILGTPET